MDPVAGDHLETGDAGRGTADALKAHVEPAADAGEASPSSRRPPHQAPTPSSLTVGSVSGFVSGCLYVVLALLAYWPVQPFSTSKVVSCGCYDVAEQMWFLAWTPHAILHGLNPFFTNALNVPFGANLAANTTMPLLGILASPITLTLGPVASFNVLIRLALCSSALSMCLVLRHYKLRWPVAFLGGLVYGFSPYMLAQGSLHLNLCFVPLLPLIVVAIDDLVVRDKHSTRRAGLSLGALVTAQYFISSELLADLGVLAVIGVIVLALRYPRQAASRGRRVGAGIAWALLPFVVLAGYPFVFSLVGPEHVVGSGFNADVVDGYRNDLLSPLVPTTGQRLAPWGWGQLGTSLVANAGLANSQGLPGPENGGYLGIPLVACWLAAGVWAVARRQGRAALLALMAAIAFVLSLGPTLDYHGRMTTTSLPFALLIRLPLFAFSVPSRFSLLSDLALTVTVAFALDALVTWLAARARRDAAVRAGLAAGALSVIALVPLFPSRSIVTAGVALPSYFSSPAVRHIAPGAVVLAYPYPQLAWDEAMLWQVQSGFRFDIIGGYVLTPFDPEGPDVFVGNPEGGYAAPTLLPSLPEILFEVAYGGDTASSQIPVAPWSAAEMRAFIVRYHVADIVIGQIGADPAYVDLFFDDTLHEQAVPESGVDVWYDVQDSPLVRPHAPRA